MHSTASPPRLGAVDHLRKALTEGLHWPGPLLEAMALWSAPQEVYRGRTYNYFIAGEAFDWQLLAQRLCQTVDGLLPGQELEDLLFSGRFPPSFDTSDFRHLLGVEKYRGYLNYFYGVTVEEALELATELEVRKRHASNGVQYKEDFSEEVYIKVYGAPQSILLARFREETGSSARRAMSLSQFKEFTYWLFKYRLEVKDKARIASDTRKGLEQLRRMSEAASSLAVPY